MYCKCGNTKEMKSGSHEVSTLHGAIEWWPEASQCALPIQVQSYECGACGRYGYKVITDNAIVYRKGV